MNRPKYSRTQSSNQPASSRGFLIMCVALLASLLMPSLASAQLSYTNSTPIVIRDNDTALPYPSSITVSGLTGVVERVIVTLNGLTHTYPDDIDILLVAPNGNSVVLMSDAGLDADLNNVNLTFNDGQPTLPDNAPITATSYSPANYEVAIGEFPSIPGGTVPPGAPSGANLAHFSNSIPNGTWQLFVVDDALVEAGTIASGWTLTLETVPLIAITNTSFTINEDSSVNYNVQVFDATDPNVNLTVTASTGVAAAGIVVSGTGTNRTVTITPNANFAGTITLTNAVQAADGGAITRSNVTLTVNAVNDAPTFTQIPNAVTTTQGVLSTNTIVRVADVDNSVNNLTFSATSSDSNVVTGATVFFTPGVAGSGTNFLTVAGVGAATGTATITITVSDGVASNATSTATVNVTVLPVRHVVFANPNAITIPASGTATPYPATVTVSNVTGNIGRLTVVLADLNHPNPDDLEVLLVRVSGTVTNSVILMRSAGGTTDANRARLTFDQGAGADIPDSGALSNMTVRPQSYSAVASFPSPAPQGGYTTNLNDFNNLSPNGVWSLFVNDQGAPDGGNIAGGFILNIFPTPDIPNIANQFTAEDTPINVTFPVTDIDNAISNVIAEVVSPGLVTVSSPATLTALGPSGTNATITITPVANVFGTNVGVIRVIAQDITANKFTNFITVGVASVNDAPTISPIQRQVTRPGVPVEGVAFTVGDQPNETPPASLIVTATSSNEKVLPTSNIILGGSGANRTISMFPVGTTGGTARVTVTVTDAGGLSSTSAFDFVLLDPGNPMFENTAIITINDNATATPYPSTITVSGLATNIAEVRVSLLGIVHPFPDDIDVMLVGPQGQKVMLMSDAGGGSDLNNVNLIFADSATSGLTTTGPTVSGTYQPTNFGGFATDTFPGTPAGPTNEVLAAFNGTNPNGTWRLFVTDDTPLTPPEDNRGGAINGGWQLSIRTAPVITPIPPQTTLEDESKRVTINIGDEQPGVNMTLTAVSSNVNLVANSPAALQFTGSGANRTLTVTPVLNASGTNHITVTATDPDGNSSSTTFVFIITPVSDPPLISDVADQSTPAGISTTNIAFTVEDPESPASSITVTATSSDQTLVPDANITLGGSGTNRTITILPAGVNSGQATITITARDPSGQSDTETFVLNVIRNVAFANNARITINDAPVSGAGTATPYPSIINVTGVNGQVSRVTVTLVGLTHGFPDDVDILLVSPDNSRKVMLLSDAGGGPPGPAVNNARLSFAPNAASQPPDNGPLVSGLYLPADYEATETLPAPAPGRPYSTDLNSFVGVAPNGDWKLYVIDDTQTEAGMIDQGWFIIIETAPVLAPIADQTTPEDTPITVRYTASDADTDQTNLVVTARAVTNSVPGLVTNIVVNTSGSSLLITPRANLSGIDRIEVVVSDNTTSVTNSFAITVTPVNDTPIVTTATNRVFTAEDVAITIPFNMSDIDSTLFLTNVTVVSSDTSIVPNAAANIVISGPANTAAGSTGTVSVAVTPATNAFGSTLLSFTVTDGFITVTNQVTVVVNSVNDLPTISNIAEQSVISGQTTTNIAFTVGDVETSTRNLIVTATSDDQIRVPNGNIVLGGSGADRTIQITTVGTTPDTVRITLVATDADGGSVTNGFDLNLGPAPGTDFSATGTITIPGAGTQGDASPYGSQITVSGQVGDVHRVFVTLNGFAHTNPDDVDILLVGPGGQKVLLMSDAGGTADVTNLRLRFGETGSSLPDETPLTSGDFAATDYGPADTFSSPAPAAPYATSLTAFKGTAPNGVWTLFVVDDAGGQAGVIQQGWTLTVETAPTITLTTPTPVVFNEDTSADISFTINDQVTPLNQLTLTASSDNTRLLPNANVTFNRAGGNIIATATPAPNESGTNNLTITVTRADGASDSIVIPMSVTPVNDLPVISRLLPRTTESDQPIEFNFFVTDVDTANTNLSLRATSSNQSVVTDQNLLFFRSTNFLTQLPDNNVLLRIVPSLTANGSSTISITVTDRFNNTFVSSNFVLTVNPVNLAPTNSAIVSPQFVEAGGSTTNIILNVGDPDSANLTVTGTSSDQALVANAGIVITPASGPPGTRLVRIAALPNVQGTTRITLTTTDNHPTNPKTAVTQFDLVVNPSRERIFSNTQRIVIRDNNSAQPYPSVINVTGLGGTVGKVEVTLNGFAHTFPDDVDVLLVSPGGQRVLLFSDAGGGNAVTNVTLTFDDTASGAVGDSGPLPANGSSGTFLVSNYDGNNDGFANPAPAGPYTATSLATFNGGGPNGDWQLFIMDDTPSDSGFVNGGWTIAITTAPSIQGLSDVTSVEDVPAQVNFTISTDAFAASNFTFRATTTNAAVVTTNGIAFTSNGTNVTLTVTPVLNATGRTEIVVFVTDATGQTASDAFLATFVATNDTPVITSIPNQTIQAGSSTPPITFDISDAETEDKDLILTITSSNPALIPTNNIVIVGNQLTITPVGAQSGTAQITLTVTDPQGAFANSRFTVTVEPRPNLFANANDIVIRDNNTAQPYPSSIDVSNVVGNISKVTVTLNALSHTFPDDIDMLLVGPQGQKVILMSDALGDPDLVRVRLTFDDTAASALPDQPSPPAITGGTFRPSNYTGGTDTFPAPAPAAPYAAALSAFNGTAANGTWSLYVLDDESPDSGLISGGWLLDITTTAPTITPIANQDLLEDTPATVNVQITDPDTPAANLVLTATSDNTNLLNVALSGTGFTRTLTLTPVANAFGTNVTVTVTVSDGTLTNSARFIVNVQAVNDAPIIAGLPTSDQTTPANQPFSVNFTISDAETASSNLTVNASVSNTALGSVAVSGSGNARTLTHTPTGATGTNRVTVIVSDGTLSTTNTFAIIITPVVSPAPVFPWTVGLDDNAWPVGNGGGPNTTFVQENGTISPLPGRPDNPEVNQQNDNDYYFAGSYTTTIPSVVTRYGTNYTPIGLVSTNEEGAERAFAGGDLDLRYHFNLPTTLASNDLLAVTFDALNLDDPSAVNTDPRFGIEVYFNGVLVQTQIVIRATQLGIDYTTPAFTLASVNARTGPGFDNIVSLRGISYNAEGGGNWMGIDYVQLNRAGVTAPGPSVPANTVVAPPTTVAGTGLRGEYWKRPPVSIPTDGATNPTNRIDTLINGFGAPNGRFNATRFSYTGNDLTPILTWLTNDAPSFVGATNHLDDGAIRFRGFINITNAGSLNIGTTSDDGSRIKIGGVDIINNDGSHGDVTMDTNVNFSTAGLYPIEITYFNGDWTSDGTGTNLNHSGNPDPAVHGGANFHLRINGATISSNQVRSLLFPLETVPSALSLDFGDAPAPFPTLLANDGARHILMQGFFLGASVDTEPNGLPTAAADGDGADENGVVAAGSFVAGSSTPVGVRASATGRLDAWIDFNRDGDWVDAGEKVFNSVTLNAGTNNLSVAVPATASAGATIARLRFSLAGGLNPTGQAPDGEVEDYAITLTASQVNTNPPIAARLTITNGPTTVQITVQGSTNATYQIESSANLQTWTPLTSVTTDAAGRGVITVPKTGLMQVFRAVGVTGGAAITSVVETGGDNETTDTVPAKWTGQTWVSGIANEPVPGLRTNDAYTAGLFRHEAPAYVDRNHQFEGSATNVALPTYLVGGEYILSGNDNRDNTNYVLLVTLSRQADVYLLIDNRLGDANGTNGPSFTTNMTWVVTDGGWSTVTNGFHRSGSATMPDEVGIDEGADGTLNQWFTVYRKRFPAGTVTLRQADNTGQNMYGVVIRPAP